jgi:hypothetical protein
MPSTRADTPQGDQERARVRAVEAGDPRAVREILTALEPYLRGHDRIPRSYALFCADSFNAFRQDDRAWGLMSDEDDPRAYPGADEEFATRDQSKDSLVETVLGLGARLSVRRLGRIGTAVCRAFHLTRQRPPAIERPLVAPAEESSLQDQAIRFTGHFDVHADFTTSAAQAGDPSALRRLLHAVECSLYEGKTVHGQYAYFCADALQQWLGDRKAWERIENYVRGAGRGSRAPINDLRPLARSFCRAFRLSRPKRLPKPGEIPRDIRFCPKGVDKFEELLEHGVTWSQARTILRGAYSNLSFRALETWVRLMKIKLGTAGKERLMANRLRLAARVRHETGQGRSLEEAYLEVARWLAGHLFPRPPSRMKRWAVRVLQDSEEGRARPQEHLELARRIKAASEQGQLPPEIPEKLHPEVLPEMFAGEAGTFLPDHLIAELVPAVRKAHTVAIELVDA